jgi:hypothetical protein
VSDPIADRHNVEATWNEEEPGSDTQAVKLLAAVQEAEQRCWEWIADGFVYQQYASGRRIPNIYGLATAGGMTYAPGTLPNYGSYDIGSDNQIAIGVETLVATVGAIKPWCHFVTTDGDYRQRIRAKRKGDYLYGLMKSTGFFADIPGVFRDAITWGWGVSKRVILKEGGKQVIKSERCVPSEVLWDRSYSLLPGQRSPIYHRRFALRTNLCREYPDAADAIMTAPGAYSGNLPGLVVDAPANFVVLAEGWWPSADGKEAGCHVLSVGSTVLNAGKTKMDPDEEHPFSFCVGYQIGPGWQYQGVVEQTISDQCILNKQNRIILENQHRGAQNRWLVHQKANVEAGSLINKTAQITRWAGDHEPRLAVFQASPPELYQDRDATRQRILTRMGVNQFAAMGTKPAGINSGEAIREYGDHSQQRHQTLEENIENYVVDAGRKLTWACEKVKPEVRAPGKRSVRLLDWSEVKLPPGSYSVELAFAISSLPRTPEGKVDKANELLQMGKLDATAYARITQNPDVDAALDPSLAAQDCIESILDGITEDGETTAPDPGLDLDLAFTLANQRYWRCVADKAPQDVLDMLVDFRDDVQRLRKSTASPAAPSPAPAAPAGPQMVPGQDAIPGPVPTAFRQ